MSRKTYRLYNRVINKQRSIRSQAQVYIFISKKKQKLSHPNILNETLNCIVVAQVYLKTNKFISPTTTTVG